MTSHKATVEWKDRRITLEGPEEFVRSELQRLTSPEGGTADDIPEADARNERQFLLQKKPEGHHEKVAALAFWLAKEGQTEFTDDGMRKAYIRAGVKPPKVMQQAIRDAKNKFGYIDTGKARGTYVLSSHGEDFVRFDLPRKHESK
jgi:hypothetical protein